ncbi:hypothetical protein PtA15_12A96 [Puccinia triticina]|uniref:Uncharacterized protein n=1 Tax=Puccinia triticina TaxID=208348 RepID=A0ABY7CXT5_9BASI|nr:uncharacterized protein PtA15_12A96 [Puccinia triticina]WAQ90111.1 hypothetical protein PtA15_12A96 [Puccinia triticina]WAR61397.1 hypothetical protein PtB15_12B82 [Puccinia triticina]
MASIYQLVSARAKGHVPSASRDSFSGSRTSHSLHHALSFTGSDTTSRSNYSGQSNLSVPSLSNSVSSQSTGLSSLASNESSLSHAFTPINPTPPSASSKLSFRSTSGASINKSIHSLLRRRKQKTVDLSLSPSLNARDITANELNTRIASQAMPKSAMVPPVPMGLKGMQSCKSALPFGSFPQQRAAEVNDFENCRSGTPTEEIVHEAPEYSQTTIFSGSLIVAKDLPLAGTHPRPPVAKSAPRRAGSGSSGEDSEMEDMIKNLRTIAQTHKPVGPVTSEQDLAPAIQDNDEDSEEDEDLEMDEMMKNLRGLAATRKDEQALPSVLAETRPVLEDIDYSDSESESSFEADVLDDDDLPDHFPLPSWPKLDSTSQSPFNQQSLRTPTYRPAECSVSLSIDRHP